MFPRRRFVQGLGLGGLALATGALEGMPRAIPRTETHWGDYPNEARSSEVPEELRAQSVLEIFLYGGISPWETFYAIDEPDYGKAAREMWWTFQDGPESVEAVYRKCLGSGAPPLLKDFTRDQNGVMVKLGPFADALRQRDDITDRLRLHVLTHDLTVHEIAVPLGLTGYRLALPRLAGVGTAVQHYFLAHDPAPREPRSYVLAPYHRLITTLFNQAAAAGAHPAYAQPLVLHVNGDSHFAESLNRKSIGPDRATSDALLDDLVARFGGRLTRDGEPVRSRVWDEYRYAAGMLKRADALSEVFGHTLSAKMAGETCGETQEISSTAMQLRLAAHLLGRPGSPTRHVSVIDGALLQDINGFGYDTHRRHVFDSGRNLSYFMKQFVSYINRPGEKDPEKIDLDRTMVIINTEFGRSPGTQNGDGRNHYSHAYVTAMFGGPIGKKQRGIVGAIDHKGNPVEPLAPAETRAAALVALGIWPFSSEGYSVSDMRDVKTTAQGAARLKERVLGLT